MKRVWRLNIIHLCTKCDKVITEGQRVTVQIESTYHVLKSHATFALDKTDLVADSETMAHVDCNPTEGD